MNEGTCSMFVRNQRTANLAFALQLIESVQAEAEQRGLQLAVAVVDPAGTQIAAQRMDGATPASLQLALDKAFTAAAFGVPTDRWSSMTGPSAPDWGLSGALESRVVVMAGGLPVRIDSELVAGLGVSGAAPVLDLECALSGLLNALQFMRDAGNQQPHSEAAADKSEVFR